MSRGGTWCRGAPIFHLLGQVRAADVRSSRVLVERAVGLEEVGVLIIGLWCKDYLAFVIG